MKDEGMEKALQNIKQSPFPEGSILWDVWQRNVFVAFLAELDLILSKSVAMAIPCEPTPHGASLKIDVGNLPGGCGGSVGFSL